MSTNKIYIHNAKDAHNQQCSLQVSKKPSPNLTISSSLCELKPLDFYTAGCSQCCSLNCSAAGNGLVILTFGQPDPQDAFTDLFWRFLCGCRPFVCITSCWWVSKALFQEQQQLFIKGVYYVHYELIHLQINKTLQLCIIGLCVNLQVVRNIKSTFL